MKRIRMGNNIAVAAVVAIFTVSCSAQPDSPRSSKSQSVDACPILFGFKSGRLLDLRKPGWNAAKDARENIRLGSRNFIGVQEDFDGIATPHDAKYNRLLNDILESKNKYKKYGVDFDGMGTLEGIKYQMSHENGGEDCMYQTDQMRLYAREYNNYLLEDISKDLKKSGHAGIVPQ